MASRVYCNNVSEELIGWSEKLHKLSSEIDQIPSIDKYKLLPQIEELHIIVTELDDRLCELLDSCATAETFESKESRSGGGSFSSRMEMSSKEHFDYDIGG